MGAQQGLGFFCFVGPNSVILVIMGVVDGVFILSYIVRLVLALCGVFIFILMLCFSLFHFLCNFHLSLYLLFFSFAVEGQPGHFIGHSPNFFRPHYNKD